MGSGSSGMLISTYSLALEYARMPRAPAASLVSMATGCSVCPMRRSNSGTSDLYARQMPGDGPMSTGSRTGTDH
eukprot:6064402-Amphidinium_carterae.1